MSSSSSNNTVTTASTVTEIPCGATPFTMDHPKTLQINSDLLNLDVEIEVGRMVYAAPMKVGHGQASTDIDLYMRWDELTEEEQGIYHALEGEMYLLLRKFTDISRAVMARRR